MAEDHFGDIESGEVCQEDDDACRAPAVAVVVPHAEDGGAIVWWLCDLHARTMAREEPMFTPRRIIRTCQVAVGDSSCGAVASHIAIFGQELEDGSDEVLVSSVCQRHASAQH